MKYVTAAVRVVFRDLVEYIETCSSLFFTPFFSSTSFSSSSLVHKLPHLLLYSVQTQMLKNVLTSFEYHENDKEKKMRESTLTFIQQLIKAFELHLFHFPSFNINMHIVFPIVYNKSKNYFFPCFLVKFNRKKNIK